MCGLAVAVSHSVAAKKSSKDLSAACCRKVWFFMKKISTRRLCMLSLFTAVTVILGIYATFRIGNQIKIPLKFITVFMTGALFGPLSAGLVAAAADILNAVLVPVGPPMLQITLVELFYGVVYGLSFYKAKNNNFYYLRTVICALVQFATGIIITTKILVDMGYFASFESAVIIRLPAAIITFILHVLVMCVLKGAIFKMKEYIGKGNAQ